MQTVPRVTRDDVVRVIRRDYAAAPVAVVLAILDRYGAEPWERERDRVHMAVLKLAGGSVPELRRQVEAAKVDYRDPLAQAEYPNRLTCMTPTRLLPPAEVEAMDERDRAQYHRWLAKG